MRKLRDFSFVVCTFLPLSGIALGFIQIYYYYLVIVIVFPLLLIKYRSIDKSILIVSSYLLINGVFNVIAGNNDLFSFAKVFTSIIIFYWFFFLVVKEGAFEIVYLMELYYKWSIAAAYIGIVQFFSYLIGFKYGYNYEWLGLRNIGVAELGGTVVYPVHSIFGEPAAFAIAMAPAVYIAISNLWNRETKALTIPGLNAIIILVSYILTQSSTGYVTLIIALILINLKRINFWRLSIGLVILPTLLITLYSISPKFQDRLDSSLNLVTGQVVVDAIQNANATNGSALILFNHFIISKKNAADHPFGTGLGSHHVAFQRYNSLESWFTGYGKNSMILNENDANSLLNRILSELGFVGIIFSAIFIVKFFIRDGESHYVLINHASLIVIFANLLRGGSYYVYGFPFFVLCYYYSYKFSSQRAKEPTADLKQLAS